MLAMEMKAAGMYVSRGLSFREAEVRMSNVATKSMENSEYFFSTLIPQTGFLHRNNLSRLQRKYFDKCTSDTLSYYENSLESYIESI